MKILQLVSSLGIGGAEKFVVDLSLQLAELKHDVAILVLDRAQNVGKCSDYENKLCDELKSAGIEIFFVAGSGRKSPFNVVKALKTALKTSKPDVVHSHLLIWSLYLSFFRFNGGHVFTQHTNHLKHPDLHRILKYKISGYISICGEATESFSKVLPAEKIKQIPNGIKLDKYTFKINKGYSEKVKFITVSRLADVKNHLLILESISQLKKTGLTNLELNIIGQGELEEVLKNKVRELALQEFVTFHGTRSDIPELLAENHVFLLPSKYEGFSIALIEALASGIKVIASDVGGNAEILGNGQFGKLIPSENLEALVSAMRHEINTKALDYRDKDKLQAHLKTLSIQGCAEKHIKLYKQV